MHTTATAPKVRISSLGTPTLHWLFPMPLLPPRPLSPGTHTIGRSPDVDIPLVSDAQASRRHAVLHVPGGSNLVELEDLGSKNGSLLNGALVTRSDLCDGDLIRLGDTLLLLRYHRDKRAEQPGTSSIPGLLGNSPCVRVLRRDLHLAASTSDSVLLLGETGVGKEIAAQALHRLSARSDRPLVILDCGAIARDLLSAELFGHEQGAFTGAVRSRPGLFEQAHGGTLFIDELGTLPLDLQPMLLRALESGTVRRIGASQPLHVDVRFLAATNEDLSHAVRAGTFRADLLARLSRLVIRLPPLRDRREDILPILQHHLGPTAPPLTADLAAALLLHPFTLNVRELINLAAELSLRGRGAHRLDLSLIQSSLSHASSMASKPSVDRLVALPISAHAIVCSGSGIKIPMPDRATLHQAMAQAAGNLSAAARHFGCSRRTVRRWLDTYSLPGS